MLLDNEDSAPNTETATGDVSLSDGWTRTERIRRRARGTRHDIGQCLANVHQDRGCTWPNCGNNRASYYSAVYGDEVPLCTQHLYEVWRIARDLAEQRQNHEPTLVTHSDTGRLEEVHVEQPVAQIGWIYYLRIGEHIKIGYAGRLLQRLRSYPPTAELLAAHRGRKVDEKVTHSLLYLHRVAGREWYDPHPEVLDYIAKVIVRYGEFADPRPTKPVLTGQPVQMRRRSGARSSRR